MLTASVASGSAQPPRAPEPTAQPWHQYADLTAAGFSPERLAAARATAEAAGSAAVFAVHRGHVIAAWGAVDRNLMANSVRTSMTGALVGLAVADGKLALDATLAELGIDDEPPLTAAEKQARLRDLLASRSGVFHPAAYTGAEADAERPARGSAAPGSRWYYNNWDFNVLESIFQRATGEDVFAAFARRMAAPLGMEDFSPTDGLLVREPGQSRFPAHVFRISARDLARFAQLYLQDGRWNGVQLLPSEWVRTSLQTHSDLGEGSGYGWLWWTYAPGSLGKSYPTLDRGPVYLARGTGGQAVFLLPALDLVVVHRGDTDNGRPVGGKAVWTLVEQIAAARIGEGASEPALAPLSSLPLASVLPQAEAPDTVPLATALRDELIGDYALGKETLRIFAHGDGLFVNVPSMGEAELFALADGQLTMLVSPGSRVKITRDASGRVVELEATIDGRRFPARRR